MPLVDAKCTNCGGALQVDSAKEAAVCPFCGSAFIVEKAVQNFNITNNIVQADVVNIYSAKRDDFLIEGGLLKKYKGAETEVVIPEGVEEIGYRAFAGTNGMTKVTFPKSLRTICGCAFESCSSLRSVAIGDDVTVESCAFDRCTALERVFLGARVTAISNSFATGGKIKSIYCGDGCSLGGHCFKADSLVLSIGSADFANGPIIQTSSVSFTDSSIRIERCGENSITIDRLEIRDDSVLPFGSDRNEDAAFADVYIKELKIGNNVQLSGPLFYNCRIDHMSVGSGLQCNGRPLGANIYKKDRPARVRTAVFADAADLKRNAAQRSKKLRAGNCPVQKNALIVFKGPKEKACEYILKKGTLQTCVCCGKDKLVQKDGKTICKKCGATYIFEDPND